MKKTITTLIKLNQDVIIAKKTWKLRRNFLWQWLFNVRKFKKNFIKNFSLSCSVHFIFIWSSCINFSHCALTHLFFAFVSCSNNSYSLIFTRFFFPSSCSLQFLKFIANILPLKNIFFPSLSLSLSLGFFLIIKLLWHKKTRT